MTAPEIFAKNVDALRRNLRSSVVCILLGAAAVGYAVWSTVRENEFLMRAVRAEGSVTGVTDSTDEDGHTTYRPTFAFADAAGRQWTVSSAVTVPDRYRIGDAVPVRYPADDPARAQIASGWVAWQWPACAALVGFCVMLPNVFGARREWKALRQQRATGRDQAILEGP